MEYNTIMGYLVGAVGESLRRYNMVTFMKVQETVHEFNGIYVSHTDCKNILVLMEASGFIRLLPGGTDEVYVRA